MDQMTTQSLMVQEAGEAPHLCALQVAANAHIMARAGAALRALDPPFVATLARGSSDQAAAFAKTMIETQLRIPVLSHAPSIGALYDATSPKMRGVPMIAISQSGRSPDLLRAAEGAKAQGALLVVLVNDEASPLADMADILVPLRAGPEKSVAATKSFIATLTALTQLVACWGGNGGLRGAVERVGMLLSDAWALDWSAALPPLSDRARLLVLGRGPTFPIAGEAALKFKETCGIHAEAFSSAEVAHGPMTLIEGGDPVMIFGPRDAARAGLREQVEAFSERGASVIFAGDPADAAQASIMLPGLVGVHPVMDAIGQIQSFYRLVNDLSLARGRDPDNPPYLSKVTRTL